MRYNYFELFIHCSFQTQQDISIERLGRVRVGCETNLLFIWHNSIPEQTSSLPMKPTLVDSYLLTNTRNA